MSHKDCTLALTKQRCFPRTTRCPTRGSKQRTDRVNQTPLLTFFPLPHDSTSCSSSSRHLFVLHVKQRPDYVPNLSFNNGVGTDTQGSTTSRVKRSPQHATHSTIQLNNCTACIFFSLGWFADWSMYIFFYSSVCFGFESRFCISLVSANNVCEGRRGRGRARLRMGEMQHGKEEKKSGKR